MYTEFYGFSEKPFELTPNPRFLYLTRSHREAQASILDGIRDRRGFISMLGGVGTGKTILIHSLLNRLDEKVRTVLIFHTTITFADLLGSILQELGLAPVSENRMDLLHQLIQHLVRMGRRGETLLLIIDEAQNLPAKVLEDLQMFCELESKGIQIVFVGQPELGDKLRSENLKRLRRSIRTRCQISGLSGAESREYIDHRLRLAGSSSSRIFSPEALSLICAYAQGVPRVINTLCDIALLKGARSFKKTIDVDIVREVIKNMEGPTPQRMMSSSSTIVRKFRAFPSGLRYLLKKAPLIMIVSLLCLGAFIFFLARRHPEQKPTRTWDIRSLENRYVDIESPPTSTPSRGTPPYSPRPAGGRQYKLKEMIAVKKGQTISQLTQKYYGAVNLTLIDFLSEVNPEITNVHLIIVDQKIKIPYITEELLMIQSADRAYKIHAGTFENPGSARNYSDDPLLKGKKIEVLPRKVSPRETWYRVMIGKFANKGEALKTISLLRKKGLLPAFETSSKK